MNPEEAINYINLVVHKFPNLNKMIDNKNLKRWRNFLSKVNSNYIYESKFNLLTLLIFHGIDIRNKYDNEFAHNVKNLLETLDYYLSIHPELKTDPSFIHKINEFNNASYFDTLSELTIASKLKKEGWNINFEAKYLKSNGKEKDIDILAKSPKGAKFYIEIYTPQDNDEVNNFFDPTILNDQNIKKIKRKSADKFSNIKTDELDGKKFLAINMMFSSSYLLNLMIDDTESIYKKIKNYKSKDIHGYIIFIDNFISNNSLIIKKILY